MSTEGEGVEEMALPGMPEPPIERGGKYEEVQETVAKALHATKQRLHDLRKQREDINAEIKLLVDEHELLERMTKIKKGKK
jgi:cell division protein FtsB